MENVIYATLQDYETWNQEAESTAAWRCMTLRKSSVSVKLSCFKVNVNLLSFLFWEVYVRIKGDDVVKV